MKKLFLIIQLFVFVELAFSQNDNYTYNGRMNPTARIDKINDASRLADLCPQLWQFMALPNKVSLHLEKIRKENFPLGYYTYPPSGYAMILDFVSMELTTSQHNKILIAKSDGDYLTPGQKNLLLSMETGTDLKVNIKFKIKEQYKASGLEDFFGGMLTLSVVPAKEASFSGSNKSFNTYLNTTIFDKIENATDLQRINFMNVKFTVASDGTIINTKIMKSSGKPMLDKLILDSFSKMPRWQPAANSSGININQTFEFRFSNDGC